MSMTTNPEAGTDGLVAMCVDDSVFDLKLNERVLTRSEAFDQILQFASGIDALAYMRENPKPDVIFLDVNMPMMDGFDFLEAATQEFGETFTCRVVIMLTSSLNPNDRARAERFEAVRAFLSKPLTVDGARDVASRVAIQEFVRR